jgi:hypothetical protein
LGRLREEDLPSSGLGGEVQLSFPPTDDINGDGVGDRPVVVKGGCLEG